MGPKEVNHPNLGAMFDTHHAHIERRKVRQRAIKDHCPLSKRHVAYKLKIGTGNAWKWTQVHLGESI